MAHGCFHVIYMSVNSSTIKLAGTFDQPGQHLQEHTTVPRPQDMRSQNAVIFKGFINLCLKDLSQCDNLLSGPDIS
jgi:hypothetical protein